MPDGFDHGDLPGIEYKPSVSLVSLAEVRLQPVPEVVSHLEELLERARQGEIRGVAVATTCDGGRTEMTSYELGDGGLAGLIVAVTRLQRRLLDVE